MPKFSPHVKRQLAILVACRFAEPFALTSVWPYLYFMVKSYGVPEKDIGFWVGLTNASFNFAQFLTGMMWGRASDRFGRKPMIVVGLLGTLLATLMFGFSTNLAMAMVARALAGGLNGNVGILRTMVAEIVPEKELQPRAYSLLPLTFTIASIFAPSMGGYLSEPVSKYPGFFKPGGLLEKYPFALPNLVCCALFLFAATFGLLFVEETLETKKHQRDIFLEMGERLISLFTRKKYDSARVRLLHYQYDEEQLAAKKKSEPQDAPSIREAFTRQSTLQIIIYMILALHVTFDQLLPVFMSYPPNPPSQQHPPLRFSGGFGMDSNEIGNVFSAFGVIGMLVQFFVFPPVVRKYGALRCFRWCAIVFPATYILAPYTVLLNENIRAEVMVALVAFKKMAEVFAFPCSTILVTNSAPSLRVLGTLNGVATASAALARAVGPTIVGMLFTKGQKVNCVLIPYLALTFVTLWGAIPLGMVEEMDGPASRDLKAEDEETTALADATDVTPSMALDGAEDMNKPCDCACRDTDTCSCSGEMRTWHEDDDDEGLPPPANAR